MVLFLIDILLLTLYITCFLFLFFQGLFSREREKERVGALTHTQEEGQEGREKDNLSRLTVRPEPDTGLDPRTMRS